MTDDELVRKMQHTYLDEPSEELGMRAALAIASPIIEREALEKAIEACKRQRYVIGAFEGSSIYAAINCCVDAIRALMEQSK